MRNIELPIFARNVLGQSQTQLGLTVKSNCINAAFNFHGPQINWEPYKPIDFVKLIQGHYLQLPHGDNLTYGDLIVMWSRTSGSWDDRKIMTSEINESDPDFPYGLVFDHVVVFLEDNLVFHKPNPKMESKYCIETLTTAMSVTIDKMGFELTYHRKNTNSYL